MPFRVALFFLCIPAFVLAQGAEGRLEDILKQMLAGMDHLTKTLGTIQDEDTAKAAHPELKKLAGDWSDLRKKAEQVRPPTREEKDRLAKEYRGKLEEAQKKLFTEMARVRLVPGGKEALQDVAKALTPKVP